MRRQINFETRYKLLPQHLLTKLAAKLSRSTLPWLKNLVITIFLKYFTVELAEAEIENPQDYPSFNAFFTRKLKTSARPVSEQARDLASAADGRIYQFGKINSDQILQAKDHYYTTADLLGGHTEISEKFTHGHFITTYLAPHNYHRVHMPLDGKLYCMLHIPGSLFPVNTRSCQEVPNLFARNERVVCLFKTEHGDMAVILVGALLVGSVTTSWHGDVHQSLGNTITAWHYDTDKTSMHFRKGDEIGYFNYGSTVIVLLENSPLTWQQSIATDAKVKMGASIATFTEQKES